MKTLKEEIKELKERIDSLEKISPDYLPKYSKYKELMRDPECLHNSCDHEKLSACYLYCRHCDPIL